MVRMGLLFSYHLMARQGFEPLPAEWHRMTESFEGLYQLSYRAAVGSWVSLRPVEKSIDCLVTPDTFAEKTSYFLHPCPPRNAIIIIIIKLHFSQGHEFFFV